MDGNYDIFDKTDKSAAKLPKKNGVSVPGMLKREKHDWKELGKKGEFAEVEKIQLRIDGRYQRGIVSETKILKIAATWDWCLCGVLMVARRDDGTLWVYDGGHRVRASMYRDDILTLPCMIYDVDSLPSEAKAFLGANLLVTNVHAIDKFKAGVVSEDETALATAALMAEANVGCGKHAQGGVRPVIKCVKALQECVKTDIELARKCFYLCLQLAGEDALQASVLSGLFLLCHHMKERFDVIEQYSEKLSTLSQREIIVRTKQVRAETNVDGKKSGALAILSLINKGKKNKIDW